MLRIKLIQCWYSFYLKGLFTLPLFIYIFGTVVTERNVDCGYCQCNRSPVCVVYFWSFYNTRHRWKDTVNLGSKVLGCGTDSARDNDVCWWALYKHSNEPLTSISNGKFLDWLSNCHLFQGFDAWENSIIRNVCNYFASQSVIRVMKPVRIWWKVMSDTLKIFSIYLLIDLWTVMRKNNVLNICWSCRSITWKCCYHVKSIN